MKGENSNSTYNIICHLWKYVSLLCFVYSCFVSFIVFVDYHLRIPVTWPLGTYGLMRSVRGCPDAKVTWSTGWRQQDNENTNTQNSHSDNIDLYLAGTLKFVNLNVAGYYFKVLYTSLTDVLRQLVGFFLNF